MSEKEKAPENIKYTKNHEWVQLEGETAVVGITDFAQESLGDIVFVELPDVHSKVEKDQTFGVVESVKSVSDLYSPVTGEVTEINIHLETSPESINNNPYEAWIIKVKTDQLPEGHELFNRNQYENYCQSLEQK